MPATTVVNGSDVHVFISPLTGATTWKTLAHATSFSYTLTMATRDTSNKGSGKYVTRAEGRLDVTGSMEGMYVDNDKYNLEDVMKVIEARTPVLLLFGKETTAGSNTPDTTTSGGVHYFASGLFYLTSCSPTFPDQANSTYTVNFEHADGFETNDVYLT